MIYSVVVLCTTACPDISRHQQVFVDASSFVMQRLLLFMTTAERKIADIKQTSFSFVKSVILRAVLRQFTGSLY